MSIKNYCQLVNLPKGLCKEKETLLDYREIKNLRKKALKIIEKGLESVQPEEIIKSQFRFRNNFLFLNLPFLKKKIDFRKFRKIFLIGFGKGAARATVALEKILGNRIAKGITIDIEVPFISRKSKVRYFKGDHPIPSKRNIKATERVIKLLQEVSPNDLVLIFVFGGGSALLSAPAIDFSLFQKINKALIKSGKSIQEINTIRKHLDKIKGGNLAKIAYPSRTYVFICSDVPGDDVSVIASGPTVKDRTTKKEAQKIAREFDWPKRIFIETPKENRYFQKTKNTIFISNKAALEAMKKEAERLGFGEVKIYSNQMQGEAKEAGKNLLKKCRKGQVLLAGGETAVAVKGRGKGGRNMELVLGALSGIKPGDIIISIDSDGRDNSEAAGAIGDIYTKAKAEKLGLKADDYLKRNDSFHFFEKTKDLIFSFRGTNIADLILVVRSKIANK